MSEEKMEIENENDTPGKQIGIKCDKRLRKGSLFVSRIVSLSQIA